MIDTKQAIEWLKQFDEDQVEEIVLGLDSGVDVTLYANPYFDDLQMTEIRWGLEIGVDVSLYADPKYSWKEMRNKRLELEREKKGEV